MRTLATQVVGRKPAGDLRGYIATVKCPVCELKHDYYVTEQSDAYYKTAPCDAMNGDAILKFTFDYRTVPTESEVSQ